MRSELVVEFVQNMNEIEIDKIEEDEFEDKYKRGVYIFVSFDLANSTLFKNRHMKKWPKFITSFYDAVMSEFAITRYREGSRNVKKDVSEKTGGFHLWKLVGDEVLLYHKVVSTDELYDTILNINDKRNKLLEQTVKKYVAITCENEEDCRRLFKQFFEVKTTIWIGSCASKAENVSVKYPNLVYDAKMQSNESITSDEQYDFLGPDIDEGFRLCEFAEKKQMVVSPKLVYLLLLAYRERRDKINVLNLNFRIVNYVSMKGVWEDRLYPIIMFCQCDLEKGDSYELWNKMFEYDAFETSFLYSNIAKYREKFFQDDRFSIRNLYNIYEDIIRDDELNAMLEVFLEQEEYLKNNDSNLSELLKKRTKFEFHISCLCYDKSTSLFWVNKHPKHGWSFGCTQVAKNVDYYNYVSKIYLDKYGLDIFLNEENKILSFYSVDRITDEQILGIVILVTEVQEKCLIENIESKWVTYDEAKQLEGLKLKEFDDILDKAQRLLDKNM